MKPGPKSRKVMVDRRSSWDGLEDIVPERYKKKVHKFLEEAHERIDELMKEDVDLKEKVRSAPAPDTEDTAARRRLVLQCLAIGMTIPEVRTKLSLPKYGVPNDLMSMRKKYKCATTFELIARAIRIGFIE